MSRRAVKRPSSMPVVIASEALASVESSLRPPVVWSIEESETSNATSSLENSPPKSRQPRTDTELIPFRVDQIDPALAYAVYAKFDQFAWVLDDTIRNPYVLYEILRQPNTVSMFIQTGGRLSGVAYAYAIVPKVSAGLAIGIWDRHAMGCDSALKIGMLALAKDRELHRLYANIAAPNLLGHRLMRRLGFEKEGELREALCYRNEWTDVAVYGMLTREIKLT